jgi:hypothetical protein
LRKGAVEGRNGGDPARLLAHRAFFDGTLTRAQDEGFSSWPRSTTH